MLEPNSFSHHLVDPRFASSETISYLIANKILPVLGWKVSGYIKIESTKGFVDLAWFLQYAWMDLTMT
jgi:hypothetical protein